MNEERPNPEELLAKIKASELENSRGKLKLFLGAAAGVGKTYAMLNSARELLDDGVDVVVGYVETHGRQETELLIPQNIEYIALKEITFKGIKVKEFDVDLALKRKPQVIILDELAHTNVLGSRNNKRYQDVLELINAGIDVYSALNIQHIESLNNIVEQITQVKVHETVPDSIIETAHEVVLIDIPVDELIERLKDGKIYPPDRAKNALENFFRKGNLTALRELSLRKTAQKVDKQVLEYRNKQDIADVWGNNDKLLVVIEPGYSREKIIRSAKNIFDKGFSAWFVGYVETPDFEEKSMREKQRVLDLLELAKQLGATSVKLIGVDTSIAIADFVIENNINTVMLSQYRLSLYYKLFGKSLAEKLSELVPEVNLHFVTDELQDDTREYNKRLIQHKKPDYFKYLKKTLHFSVLFGALGMAIQTFSSMINNENILMIYLLFIILSNPGRGKISAIISATIAALSFCFFFVPPKFSFMIAEGQYIVTFICMAIISVTINVINGNLRYQISELTKIKFRSDILQEVNQKFAKAMVEKQIYEIIPNYFVKIFNAKFMLLIPNLDEKLCLKCGSTLAGYDENVASWVFNNGKSAGLNTNTFATSNILYVPVFSEVRVRGVLIINPQNKFQFFSPTIQTILNNFVSLVAYTLERIHFNQIALQTELELLRQGIKK